MIGWITLFIIFLIILIIFIGVIILKREGYKIK